MSKRRTFLGRLALSACLALGTVTAASALEVKLEEYVTGLNAPLAMVQPAGDDRKFVIEQF